VLLRDIKDIESLPVDKRKASAVLFLDGAFVSLAETAKKVEQLQQHIRADVMAAVGLRKTSSERYYWCRILSKLKGSHVELPMELDIDDIELALAHVGAMVSAIQRYYKEVILVGYSQGAIISLLAHLFTPELVKKLVLACPGLITNYTYHAVAGSVNLVFAENDLFVPPLDQLEIARALVTDATVLSKHTHQWSDEMAAAVVEKCKAFL